MSLLFIILGAWLLMVISLLLFMRGVAIVNRRWEDR